MPDIDPAALSRPAASLSTPILKSITVSAPTTQKVTKTSQIIPARIDLEPLYTALKSSIGIEQWTVYKESTTQFLLGKLSLSIYPIHCFPSFPFFPSFPLSLLFPLHAIIIIAHTCRRPLEPSRILGSRRSHLIIWKWRTSPLT